MPSFLWLSNILLCIYTTASSSIHLVTGHLGCLHVLAIVNSAAMNNGIHVSLSVLVSSRYMPRSGIAGSCGGFIPSFLIFIYFFFLVPILLSSRIYLLHSKRSYLFLNELSEISYK